jgi:GTP-binding protein
MLQADEGLSTLAGFRYKRAFKAKDGKAGSRNKRHGADGQPLIVKVPVGTVLKVVDSGETWDLDKHGALVVVARGGEGGKGNARFATSVRQAPRFAEKGLPGETLDLQLELKLLADVGLVGLPNAGKSTLLRAVSKARPKVGPFPFTTLEPVLGVVDLGLRSFVVADLPGLIEGAHAGAGLGLEFLRHVARTRVLVHVVDAGAADPLAGYKTVRHELELYDPSLADKPEVIVLNKVDIEEGRQRAKALGAHFGDRQVLMLSGATGEGVDNLVRLLERLLYEQAPFAPVQPEAELPVLRPHPRAVLEVSREDDTYIVRGEQAAMVALKLGDGGPEALDELQKRLGRMGLGHAMRHAGARPGARVRVGAVDLVWQG